MNCEVLVVNDYTVLGFLSDRGADHYVKNRPTFSSPTPLQLNRDNLRRIDLGVKNQ